MKRILAVLTMVLFAATMLSAGEVKDAAKEAACKAACVKSKEKCDEKAGGSKLKQIGCQKSYESCVKDCEKEEAKEKK